MPASQSTILGAWIRRQCELYEDLIAVRFVRNGRAREITYGDLSRYARRIAAGIWRRGFKPGAAAVIVGRNSPEWLLTYMAVHYCGGIDAALEESADLRLTLDVIQKTGAKFLFSDREDLLAGAGAEIRSLRLVHMSWKRRTARRGLHTFTDLESRGRALRAFVRFLSLPGVRVTDDAASVLFKRTAPGDPDPVGVVLTHRGILRNVLSFASIFPTEESDRLITATPFHRAPGRLPFLLSLHSGVTLLVSNPVDFFRHSRALKPTLAIAPPGVLNMLLRRVRDGVFSDSALELLLRRLHLLLVRMYHISEDALSGEFSEKDAALNFASAFGSVAAIILLFPFKAAGDWLMRRTFEKRLGGRLRVALTGGERLHRSLEDLFRTLDIALLEGYWISEASGIAACRTLEFTGQRRRLAPGTVGACLPGVELRLMNSRGEDVSNLPWAEGRIYLRSEALMQGYFQDPEKTAGAIDEQGWLATRDYGRLTANGDLQLMRNGRR